MAGDTAEQRNRLEDLYCLRSIHFIVLTYLLHLLPIALGDLLEGPLERPESVSGSSKFYLYWLL